MIQKIPRPRSRILNAAPTYPFVSTRSLNRLCLHPERNPQDESANSRQPTHLAVEKISSSPCRYLESYIHDGEQTEILFFSPSRFFPPQTSQPLARSHPPHSISARRNIIRTIAALLVGWLDDWIAGSTLLLLPTARSFRFLFPILVFLDAAGEREASLRPRRLVRSRGHTARRRSAREKRDIPAARECEKKRETEKRTGSLTNSSKTFRCNSAVITGGQREAGKLKKKKGEEKWERKRGWYRRGWKKTETERKWSKEWGGEGESSPLWPEGESPGEGKRWRWLKWILRRHGRFTAFFSIVFFERHPVTGVRWYFGRSSTTWMGIDRPGKLFRGLRKHGFVVAACGSGSADSSWNWRRMALDTRLTTPFSDETPTRKRCRGLSRHAHRSFSPALANSLQSTLLIDFQFDGTILQSYSTVFLKLYSTINCLSDKWNISDKCTCSIHWLVKVSGHSL